MKEIQNINLSEQQHIIIKQKIQTILEITTEIIKNEGNIAGIYHNATLKHLHKRGKLVLSLVIIMYACQFINLNYFVEILYFSARVLTIDEALSLVSSQKYFISYNRKINKIEKFSNTLYNYSNNLDKIYEHQKNTYINNLENIFNDINEFIEMMKNKYKFNNKDSYIKKYELVSKDIRNLIDNIDKQSNTTNQFNEKQIVEDNQKVIENSNIYINKITPIHDQPKQLKKTYKNNLFK